MRVVFVAYIRTHILALRPQAEWLKARGVDVSFYLASKKCLRADDRDLLMSHGIDCFMYDGSSSTGVEMPHWESRRDPVGYSYRRPDSCWRQMFRASRFYTDLLKAWKADALVLPEENVGYMTNMLVCIAKSLGIRALVMPYTLDNPLEAAEAYYQSKHFVVDSWWRKWFARRYPHWARCHKGIELLRLPFWAAVMTEHFGFAPKDPWQNTCNFADAVAVESEADAHEHEAKGIPKGKLMVIGSVVLDQIAEVLHDSERLKASLLADLGLDPSKPVFMAAIPPDQFNTDREGCEFGSHAEIVAFWLESLAATGWNVIVNLHPHLKPENMNFGSWPNVKYCARPTADVIPLCDVFVACISATIRWAIAAGKPVINHDLYLYRYDDYTDAPGIVHVETKAAFADAVSCMVKDRPEAVPHPDWGILDGKSGERLLSLLHSLTTSRNHA